MALTPSAMKLKPGDSAPAFIGLPCATCGKSHSLQDFVGSDALLIIFMCNHCPYVKAKVEVIKQLHAQYSPKGLAVVGVSSNDATEYPEDDFATMRKYASEGAYGFHYLYDESQEVARAYGATCTPDPFLFDSQLRLAYHGRINNAMEPGQRATTADLADALQAVLAGRQPADDFIPSIGCSIKWRKAGV